MLKKNKIRQPKSLSKPENKLFTKEKNPTRPKNKPSFKKN